MRMFRRLARNDRGAVLTEFGFVLVPMILIMLGLLDLGYMMYLRATLQGGVADIARLASVQSPTLTGTGTLDQKIDAAIKERVAPLARNATYTITKSNYYEFSRIGKPEKLTKDVDNDNVLDRGDCWQDLDGDGSFDSTPTARTGIGGADDIAVYTVQFVMPRMLPIHRFAGLSPNYDITVRAVVRNQPYANQPAPPIRCST